jgi:hypothetical protein
MQVVGGQQPQRDVFDARFGAPGQQVVDVAGPYDMAVVYVVKAGGTRPSPIAVEHYRDVPRHRPSGKLVA